MGLLLTWYGYGSMDVVWLWFNGYDCGSCVSVRVMVQVLVLWFICLGYGSCVRVRVHVLGANVF
jgi:hypothetical protein